MRVMQVKSCLECPCRHLAIIPISRARDSWCRLDTSIDTTYVLRGFPRECPLAEAAEAPNSE